METVLAPEQLRKKIRGVWTGMHNRCKYPSQDNYAYYGGRGIYVVDEWKVFDVFFQWSLARGYAPKLTLDRVENNGPYAPWNCRYVDRFVQMNNVRPNIHVTAFGETKTVAQWLSDPRCAVDGHRTITGRIESGMSPEEAISTPGFDHTSRWIELFGERRSLTEWLADKRIGVSMASFYQRIRKGMTDVEALTAPVDVRRLRKSGDSRRTGAMT